jgi:hypothetical protein
MGTLLRACIVVVLLLVRPPSVCAQTGAGSLKVTGQVSGVVAVSLSEVGAAGDGARVAIDGADGATIAVSIYGSGPHAARVRLPLQLRSNVGYSLRASFLSADALTARVSVDEVRATGKFVRAGAAEAAKRHEAPGAPFLTVGNRTPPVVILSGPAVSKAGTLGSPGNSLEVVLSVEVGPRADAGPWSTQLTISAAPSR